MEHHHGFDYTPNQPTATCSCGEMRINPTYNPSLGKMPYYAFYCGCGEYSTGNSGIEYETFAQLHSHCRRPAQSTGVHLHVQQPANKVVRQYRKLRYELVRTYNKLMFRLTNTGK